MRNKILLLAMVLPLVMGLVALPAIVAGASGITVYVVPAITNDKILPDTSISADYISSQISIVACPGEYEPASFVVRANEDIASLTVAPTALTGANGSIPSTSIDVRVVKCWYQAGTESIVRQASDPKALTPELLLKDDSLVKVQGSQNYLKLTSGNYVWISQEGSSTTFEYTPIANLPVQDSPTLQPVSIPSGTNKQFWVTVEVPDGSLSGIYSGSIQLRTSAGLVGELQLRLEVLPIELSQPYLSYGLTYFGILGDVGSISQTYKNEEQYRAEIEDLVAHGTINTCSMQPFNATLGQVLTIRNDAGMSNQTLYYRGLYAFLWGSGIPTDLAAVEQKVSEVAAFTATYGTQAVYHYVIDEGEAEVLVAQIPVWEAIHTAGGKVNAGGGDDYAQAFDLVGDTLDLYNWPGEPSVAEAAKWHTVGHKIWSYGNPQAGVERPETYRRNYGLLLWQSDFDGASDFAYQWGHGSLWNDFDDATYRDHVMAYPTMNGVIDTIQWEGWREGVDDARYLTTLLKTIKEAKAAGKDTSAAENWLAALKSSDLDLQDLDDIRSTMIGYILSFAAGSSSDVTPPAITSIGHSVFTSPLATTTITWTTDERATSQVEYGKTSALGTATALDTPLLYDHKVTLTGLTTNTTYYFRVKSKDASGNLTTSNILTLSTSSSLSVSFTAPSDADKAAVSRNWTEINTSISATYEASALVDWNRSLVGYWDFDENSGSIAYDRSTYSNNGALKNAPQWTAGKFGSALLFDGVDDYVDCGSSSTLNPANAITIEAWVKTSKAGWNTIATKLNGSSNGYWFGTNSAGNLYLFVYNNGTLRAASSSSNICDGAWHHVVGIYDGYRIVFYVDGNTVYTKDWGGFLAIGAASGNSLYISSTGTTRFTGVIDEVRIWNRALSSEEITASYDANTNGLSQIFADLADGTYQYYAYVTDATGNSAKTETRTITVDTDGRPGDTNSDGIINTADLTLLERIIVGLEGTTADADANQDGKINTADLTTVEAIIAGIN